MFDSIKTLLTAIVDYAGLFPPAKLDLQSAMQNYVQARSSPYHWMLGRFVLPTAQWEAFQTLLPSFPESQWSLSLIVSQEQALNSDAIQFYCNRTEFSIALEFPPLSVEQIDRIADQFPFGINTFFEIPFNQALDPYLDLLQQTGAAAKIRTGGITPDAFPSTSQLAERILAFAAAKVPFKATAGLHHPLPAHYRLTYEPNSPQAPMHGFFNVALLAAFAYSQPISLSDAIALLQEPSMTAFQIDPDRISWNHYTVDHSTLKTTRTQFFSSFGSCSFQEPIDDLTHLNLC